MGNNAATLTSSFLTFATLGRVELVGIGVVRWKFTKEDYSGMGELVSE